MKWVDMLHLVGNEPVVHSSVLITGSVDAADVRRQISRWVRSGNLIRIRRGLYALAEQYRKKTPHPFLVANRMKRASYVSLQSALQFYGLIPEYVATVTSVTTGRPEILATPLGDFIFKHVQTLWFRAYRRVDLGNDQTAFVATPEKALLDLFYLTPDSDNLSFLRELRLQNVEALDRSRLLEIAESGGSPKVIRAAKRTLKLIAQEGPGKS